MGATENRSRYGRSKLRCPSDLTNEEWSVIKPLIPLSNDIGNPSRGDAENPSTPATVTPWPVPVRVLP